MTYTIIALVPDWTDDGGSLNNVTARGADHADALKARLAAIMSPGVRERAFGRTFIVISPLGVARAFVVRRPDKPTAKIEPWNS